MFNDLGNLLVWIVSIEHIHLALYIIFLIGILVSEKSPESMVAWIFTITVFPIFGFILYIVFGVNWRKNRITGNGNKKRRTSILNSFSGNFMKYDPEQFFDSKELRVKNLEEIMKNFILGEEEKEIVKLLYETERTYLTNNSSYKMFYDGREAFASIIRDIENAKEVIYMEYFIWRSDELGEKIKNLLIKKAKQGVKIKLLFDGMGSMGTISRKYRRELSEVGVEFRYFLDIKYKISKLNYRNHRKMTIIDHKILHTGGMNLGEEYITGGKRFKSWRDTNIRIEGELVIHYLAIFAADWLNSGGKEDFEKEKIDRIIKENRVAGDNSYLMQVSSSGPDTVWASLKYMYSKMIAVAKEEVLIQSPYFIPDMSLISQLQIASLSGIKIKIMITGVPDKKIPYWIAETYFEELLSAGVEIYRYNAGFLHCKNIVTDGKFSTMGTCNFDMRSFEINYEVNTVFYNEEISQDMKEQFYKDLEKCEKIEVGNLKKMVFWRKIRNSLFKVVSPIM
ncbi:cardiolipin synthase [Leptotrichia sp. OH3620_COT-345]|uniref:cardiolipin synthase n=1 Tax=Leptotrichia sp. OH3620_COT-345 TaxID=2491048 RepID=UPI000F64D03B|nr:cardiolipin synthase [Leptotrichia sp. OH3620_COT-345]RRD38953.1 cardiolipin synthase [Leptotrichia sp. OH3620_COT-345]